MLNSLEHDTKIQNKIDPSKKDKCKDSVRHRWTIRLDLYWNTIPTVRIVLVLPITEQYQIKQDLCHDSEAATAKSTIENKAFICPHFQDCSNCSDSRFSS